MEVEDDGPVRGEDGFPLLVGDAVGVKGWGNELEEVDNVDEADF